MTTERGSDEMFLELGDMSEIGRGARHGRIEQLLEDWRVRSCVPVDDPGEDHPDPDETPPGDPPEYDPLPPTAA